MLVAEQSGLIGALDAGENGLCFGRLDFQDGRTHHIGRIGIRADDLDRTPLVIDWRASRAPHDHHRHRDLRLAERAPEHHRRRRRRGQPCRAGEPLLRDRGYFESPLLFRSVLGKSVKAVIDPETEERITSQAFQNLDEFKAALPAGVTVTTLQ